MNTVLRWTGIGKLISFYRYFSFNGPRLTTALGIVPLLGIAAIRLYWLAGGFLLPAYPAYLAAYFALLVFAALLAAAGMVVGRRPGPVQIGGAQVGGAQVGGAQVGGAQVGGAQVGGAQVGWTLGSLVSAASIAMYLASRTVGLPGLPQLVDRWDYALGSFAMALAALFVALHFSVLTGMNVAYPHRRQWHD
ncbi:MAG TPA: hypothetical protein VN327_11365 [Pseudonocardiaceae bacterium]|nr:hypothetical protein [Pseudonocardiaceae bacterium]